MEKLKVWGATDLQTIHEALIFAADGGHVDCMQKVVTWQREWGATDLHAINAALCNAAENGHVTCMKLAWQTAKEWSVTIDLQAINNALYVAAQHGRSACLELAKEWGATNFDASLHVAAYEGNVVCQEKLVAWQRERETAARCEVHSYTEVRGALLLQLLHTGQLAALRRAVQSSVDDFDIHDTSGARLLVPRKNQSHTSDVTTLCCLAQSFNEVIGSPLLCKVHTPEVTA